MEISGRVGVSWHGVVRSDIPTPQHVCGIAMTPRNVLWSAAYRDRFEPCLHRCVRVGDANRETMLLRLEKCDEVGLKYVYLGEGKPTRSKQDL